MALELADGESHGVADSALVERVSRDHVRRGVLILINEPRLSEPAREKSHGRLNSFLLEDSVDVRGDLSVVDEGHPRLEALGRQLVLELRLGVVLGVEALVLIGVEVVVAADLRQPANIGHHDNVEVA